MEAGQFSTQKAVHGCMDLCSTKTVKASALDPATPYKNPTHWADAHCCNTHSGMMCNSKNQETNVLSVGGWLNQSQQICTKHAVNSSEHDFICMCWHRNISTTHG